MRLRFASDGILSAAKFIGEMIAFEFDQFVESLLQKEGVLNSHKNVQFWQIAQTLLFIGEMIAFELEQSVESLMQKEGVFKSYEIGQFWQIAQPLLSRALGLPMYPSFCFLL